MLATVQSYSLDGLAARAVRIETDVCRGLPSFTLLGLPDTAVRESRERIRAALVNSGFEFPLRRIVSNLAPLGLRQADPGFDLPLAVALLAASRQIQLDTSRFALVGELALSGGVRSVKGIFSAAEAARSAGVETIVVPAENSAEAALVDGIKVIPLTELRQIATIADGNEPQVARSPDRGEPRSECPVPDLADLRGQPELHRALEVSAAGPHNLLLVGFARTGGRWLAGGPAP
jgi:magnesium chelatase family protein